MILTDDRSMLDKACADSRTTILVLSGTKGSRAETVHGCMEDGDWEPWYRWFLITDLRLLTADEKNRWFAGNNQDRYAVLGGDPPKSVAAQGKAEALLLPDSTECDTLTIMEELSKGDEK